MNSTDPSDYSPLAFGAGLAIGLLLLLGLPRSNETRDGSERGVANHALQRSSFGDVAERANLADAGQRPRFDMAQSRR